MIAYTKRLEFQIRKYIDTPIKMFKILKSVTTKANPYGKEFLNEDIKQDDCSKINKFTFSLTSPSYGLIENHVLSINFNEFVNVI